MKERKFEKVLIVRTDRIGDVILTLPMVPVLREGVHGVKVSMLLRSYTSALVEGFAGLDQIITYDTSGEQKRFLALLSELRTQRYDVVVVSHPTFRIALLTAIDGIRSYLTGESSSTARLQKNTRPNTISRCCRRLV